MKYKMTGRVRYSEIGPDSRMTIQAVINYLQDCCTFQSEDIGRGMDVLTKAGYCWMLNNWQIVVNRFPVMAEEIVVETWPYAFKGFFGFRNFTISTPEGEVLVYVHSGWTLVDIANGHPARIPKEVIEGYEMEPAYPMEIAPRKLKLPEQTEKGSELTVPGHFLDTNHHMNNGHYAALAADLLPEDFVIREVRIEYKKQVLAGEKIFVESAELGDKYVCVVKNADGEACAIAEFLR